MISVTIFQNAFWFSVHNEVAFSHCAEEIKQDPQGVKSYYLLASNAVEFDRKNQGVITSLLSGYEHEKR